MKTQLIQVIGSTARIEFDRVRKLKPRHRFIRNAVISSGKAVNELVLDHFGGHPFLLMALLAPALGATETLTLDDASDLIDQYRDKGGTAEELRQALLLLLSDYLHVEIVKPDTEDSDNPNAATQVEPGPSAD